MKLRFLGLFLLLATQACPQSHSVTLSWTAPSDVTTSTTYNIYRAIGVCSPLPTFTKINSTEIKTLTFVDTNVNPGVTYAYVATAQSGNAESVYSNCAQATIPSLPPSNLGATVK